MRKVLAHNVSRAAVDDDPGLDLDCLWGRRGVLLFEIHGEEML